MAFIKHGEERVKKFLVNGGETLYTRREKYCVIHGWQDLFMVDELNWYRRHFNCGKEIEPGAAPETEIFRKAA